MTITQHLVFWIFMFLFIFDYHFESDNWAQAIIGALLEITSYVALVYTNLYILIPRLLYKNKFLGYGICFVLMYFIYITIIRYSGLETIFYNHTGWRNILSMVLNVSLFLLISTMYWYSMEWYRQREENLRLAADKIETELNLLRTQISPHFIFNSLNNIYSLALQKHENTGPMIAKLSGLLRHVLYEINLDFIPLEKEISILRQYIDMQLLRNPKSTNIDFYMEGNTNNWKIAPMILINFIENAFKHSNIDNDVNAWIKICIIVDENGMLEMTTDNNNSPMISLNTNSIGLENVKRQLALKYLDKHQLSIIPDEESYNVTLKLNLS